VMMTRRKFTLNGVLSRGVVCTLTWTSLKLASDCEYPVTVATAARATSQFGRQCGVVLDGRCVVDGTHYRRDVRNFELEERRGGA